MRESLDGGHVKGGVISAHLDWADSQGLAGFRPALIGLVSPATARVLKGPVLPIVWYPFRALVELDRAIAAVRGGDGQGTLRELGRYSARRNLTTSYRFYNRSQPHEFFALVVRMHAQYLDFGQELYVDRGPTSCEIVLSDYTCHAREYCQSALGYYEEATRLQGGNEPTVSEAECVCEDAPVCRYQIAWS